MTSPSIEIIGGGLAGLSLGIALRRAEVPVRLHEAGDYPRHRVCGEFIAGLAPTTVARLALEDILSDALQLDEVAWRIGAHLPRFQRLPQPALGISRHTLDARLAERFVALGGKLMTRSRVTDQRVLPGRIFATGRRPSPEPKCLGLKMHVHRLELVRPLEMHLGAQCYVGLSQLTGGVVNVCGLFRRRPLRATGGKLLLGYLRAAGLDELAMRLKNAAPDPESFCAVAALGFDRRVVSGDAVALGDAGAAIPPFTGNGMAMALQSAELAIDPLVAFAGGTMSWPEAGHAIQRALREKFRVRLASADALHPFLLRPRRQRCLSWLGRTRLLPFGPLYAALH